jgi:hypothetical protein
MPPCFFLTRFSQNESDITSPKMTGNSRRMKRWYILAQAPYQPGISLWFLMIGSVDMPDLMDELLVLFCPGFSLQEPIRDLSRHGHSFLGQ